MRGAIRISGRCSTVLWRTVAVVVVVVVFLGRQDRGRGRGRSQSPIELPLDLEGRGRASVDELLCYEMGELGRHRGSWLDGPAWTEWCDGVRGWIFWLGVVVYKQGKP